MIIGLLNLFWLLGIVCVGASFVLFFVGGWRFVSTVLGLIGSCILLVKAILTLNVIWILVWLFMAYWHVDDLTRRGEFRRDGSKDEW